MNVYGRGDDTAIKWYKPLLDCDAVWLFVRGAVDVGVVAGGGVVVGVRGWLIRSPSRFLLLRDGARTNQKPIWLFRG